MAKCTVCNARKGKRKCMSSGTFICSLCCGETRNEEKCEGCSFYKGPAASRKYRMVPYYEIREMSDSMELQGISENIEAALCGFDSENAGQINDSVLAGIIERTLDKYHFKDKELSFQGSLEESGFGFLGRTIQDALKDVPEERLVKVLSAVYRSIQRRTNGGREYINFASRFVGAMH